MKTTLETVLVGVDDANIQQVIKDRVCSMGLNLIHATNGGQALEMIAHRTPIRHFAISKRQA